MITLLMFLIRMMIHWQIFLILMINLIQMMSQIGSKLTSQSVEMEPARHFDLKFFSIPRPGKASCDGSTELSCVFPFRVSGRMFNSCTNWGSWTPYCATSVSEDFTDTSRAYCDDTCPGVQRLDVETLPNINPYNQGDQCCK